jgi:DNA primase
VNGWLSEDENKAIRSQLAQSLSFESVAHRYSSHVESVNSVSWTHKCTCPFHKGGSERTPSLNFSDTEKTFFCYGCSARGDIFDFIGMIRGSPGSAVADRYRESKNISIDLSATKVTKPRINIHEFNIQLSVAFRDYLSSLSDYLTLCAEIEWAESVFKRIDERFSKLTDEDVDQVRNFSSQILVELERRRI